MNYFFNRGSCVYAAALDISKAFDRINHYKLFNSLFNAGLPSVMFNTLCNRNSKLFVWELKQTVCIPTRGKTILDKIYTNIAADYCSWNCRIWPSSFYLRAAGCYQVISVVLPWYGAKVETAKSFWPTSLQILIGPFLKPQAVSTQKWRTSITEYYLCLTLICLFELLTVARPSSRG